MATSGVFISSPTVAVWIDEAYERCGMDPANITSRHSSSARRSISFMLTHWSNRGILQWAVDVQTKTLTIGDQSFTPAAGTIDLLDVTLLRDDAEVPMHVISRNEYHMIQNKDHAGRPDRFFVDRSITPTVYIWPQAENSTDVIRYYRIRQLQDAGVLSNNLEIPPRFYEAFVADLAARLAEKWAPVREDALKAKAEKMWQEARDEDRERADLRITTKQGAYRGRR